MKVNGNMNEFTRQKELIDLLNEALAACAPIKHTDFNVWMPPKNGDDATLRQIESENEKLGVNAAGKNAPWSLTTLSLMATITDVLCDKRLAATIDADGYIIGVQWFIKQGKEESC